MKISDFNISGQPIPQDVADKILEYHLRPLERASQYLGFDLAISKKSGYRPLWWEKQRGRDGGSQHVFFGKGGADITTLLIREQQILLSKGKIKISEYREFAAEEYESKKLLIREALIVCTDYSRIAEYGTFTHTDFGIQDERWLFNSKWQRIKRLDEDIDGGLLHG